MTMIQFNPYLFIDNNNNNIPKDDDRQLNL
jgi:hypothetical protein